METRFAEIANIRPDLVVMTDDRLDYLAGLYQDLGMSKLFRISFVEYLENSRYWDGIYEVMTEGGLNTHDGLNGIFVAVCGTGSPETGATPGQGHGARPTGLYQSRNVAHLPQPGAQRKSVRL